jgi:colanic acid biosynthesis glycosyl transferase WcaI
VKPLRIIFLTQWFDPEPTLKGLGFAQALAARGHLVEVVTGFPNYPGGRVYDGFRIRPMRREQHGGVAVTRLALIPSHSNSKVGRIANYLSFWLSTCIYLLFVARKADVVYVYHPPITVGLAAAIARLFRRTPTVLDVQDIWPDTLRATGMIGNARILRIIDRLCSWVYRHVDRITVISPGFGRLIQDRGVPAEKIVLVMNWAPEMSAPPAITAPFRTEHRFCLLYAGNMGPAQGLATVLEAASLVRAKDAGIGFYFLGSGISVDTLKAKAAALQLDNVVFLPRVGLDQVGGFMQAADVLLVHLIDDPLFAITIPSKTQAYLAAGKPILLAVAGDAADLIAASGGGVTVAPNDPAALAAQVLHMAALPAAELQHLGSNAARFYNENLSLAQALNKLEAVFAGLAQDGRGAAG